PADKEFVNSLLRGNVLKRLLGIGDGEWHQKGARPGRDFVDVEPEPLGEQNDLGRNCRDRVVIVLPEEAQVNLGEGVDRSDAAQGKNTLAGLLELRMIGAVAP